jgi:hypothetical protein
MLSSTTRQETSESTVRFWRNRRQHGISCVPCGRNWNET